MKRRRHCVSHSSSSVSVSDSDISEAERLRKIPVTTSSSSSSITMPGGGGGKGRKQPYVLFCQEQSDVDPALRGKTLPQLVSLCNERWTSLEPRDRQRYVDMAREYNRPGAYPGSEPPPADGDWRGRFDCYGRSMAALKLKAEMAECEMENIPLVHESFCTAYLIVPFQTTRLSW